MRRLAVLVCCLAIVLAACQKRNPTTYPTPPLVDVFSESTTGDCGPGLVNAWYDEGTQGDIHGPRAIQIIHEYGACLIMAGRGNGKGNDFTWWFVWYVGGPSPDELDDLVRQ